MFIFDINETIKYKNRSQIIMSFTYLKSIFLKMIILFFNDSYWKLQPIITVVFFESR